MKIEVKDDKVSLQIDGAFTAEELTDLVAQIGEARAQIADDGDTPEGQPAYLANNARYWSMLTPDRRASLLLLRLPANGWVGIPLPLAEVANLAGIFIRQLAGAAAAATGEAAAADPDPGAAGGGMLH